MQPNRWFGVGSVLVWPSSTTALVLVMALGLALTARSQDSDWKLDRVDPKGHSGEVVAVAQSGDSKTLATASFDGLAKVWTLGDSTLKHRVDLVGHDGQVNAVAVSPDGKLVATGGIDRTVRFWDSSRGTLLATGKGGSGAVEALAFSPDGKLLASGGLDTIIRLWDVAERRVVRTLQGHEQGVRALAFAPDGKTLVSGGRDNLVKLWNVDEGTAGKTLGHHDAIVWCVAFAPDGLTVASGGFDRTVRLWRVDDAPPQRPDQPLPAQLQIGEVIDQGAGVAPGQVEGVTFLSTQLGRIQQGVNPQPQMIRSWRADGEVLAIFFLGGERTLAAAVSDLGASRSTPGAVRFFPIPNNTLNQPQPQAALRPTIQGHLGPIWSLVMTRHGQSLSTVTVGGDASVRVWELATGQPLASSVGTRPAEPIEKRTLAHFDPVEALALSADGRRVVTATKSAGVSLWSVADRAFLGRLRDPAGPVRALSLSPDGKLLATGGDGKAVSLWDATSGLPIEKLKGHLGAITALAFSPDGKVLASSSKDASVTLWDVAKRTEILTLARHTSAVTCLAFSFDSKMLATGGLDYSVKLWEVANGQYIDSFEGAKDVVDAVAFSPDGGTLASGDRTGTVRFWDVARRLERLAIQAFNSPVRALTFDHDGKTLFGGGDEMSIRRWDSGDGKVVALQSLAHQGPIRALGLDPTGKTLATAGDDRQLKLWDTTTRLAPRPFADLSARVLQVAVSPDGKTLATWSADNQARIWDIVTGRERTAALPFLNNSDLRLAFSPDSQTLALLPVHTSNNNNAMLVDVANGQTRANSELMRSGDDWAVAFAPDGKAWATAENTTVHLWGVTIGRQVRDFLGAKSSIRSLAFAPDGKSMLAGGKDGSLTVWDVADNKKPRAIFQPSTKEIGVLAISPDGRTVAVGGLDRVVRLIDPATGQVRQTFRGPKKTITSLAFSPDGRSVAWANDGEAAVTVRDVVTGVDVSNPVMPDPSAGESFASVAFAPDGRTLFVGGDRGVSTFAMSAKDHPAPVVVQTEQPKRNNLELATLSGHAEAVRSLIFVDDGKSLVTRSEDGVVKVWDLADHNRDRLTLGGADLKIRAMAVAPDGKSIAVGLRPVAVKREPVIAVDGEALPGLPPPRIAPDPAPPAPPTPGTAPAPAPPAPTAPVPQDSEVTDLGRAIREALKRMDQEKLYSILVTGETTALRQIPTQPAPAPAPTPAPAQVPPGQVPAPTPPPTTEAAAPQDQPSAVPPAPKPFNEAKVWSLETGAVVGTIADKATLPNQNPRDMVVALAYSRDGKSLATASRSGVVKVWDAAALTPRTDLAKREGGGVDVIQFSPDGKTLAAANAVGLVTIWNVETGKIQATFTHLDGMNQVLFSPDGKLFATGGGKLANPNESDPATDGFLRSGGEVRLWDVANGQRVAVLPMPSGKVMRIAFSPDGKSLAASTTAPVVTLWDVESLEPRVSMNWSSGPALYLTFSPDSKTLAVGGEDDKLRVWDVPAGTLRAELAGHTDAINWVGFSPDGQTIATASRDTTIKLWATPPPRPPATRP